MNAFFPKPNDKNTEGWQAPKEAVLAAVGNANRNAKALMETFQMPNGPRIDYDPAAPKDRWVIKSIDGQPVDRAFDQWPRMLGESQ